MNTPSMPHFGALLMLATVLFGADSVTVEKPWVRATALGQKAGGLFGTITNAGASSDRLLRVECAIAKAVEIHEMVAVASGTMRMQELANGLVIPAKELVVLKPGSFHVMLMGIDRQLTTGATVTASFVFEKAGTITREVPILEAGAMSADETSTNQKAAK